MLRPATDADADRVRIWRNHPEVRRVSLTRHEISEAEHFAWWARVAADPTRLVLLYERGGEPSGVVTFFDLDPEGSEQRTGWWGYYLDNAGLEARGELLPAWIQIQREAVRYADDALGLAELHGEVLGINEAVRRLNRRNGFAEVGSDVRDLDGEQVEVFRVVRRRGGTAATTDQPVDPAAAADRTPGGEPQ
ncbi:GNAT family N-acetyltransferase [Microlunatus sp. Y2014]|uniref:GNAT family N-acetyltransferase n=1 Tax=Microlunatus sp. Y2014 TaxID=3418488 RepID=UPI003DA7A248